MNDNNSENEFSCKINSLEKVSQSKKSIATASRNKIRKDNKFKKLLCKKGERVKVRRNNLFHVLVDIRQKKGMVKYGNIR